MNTSDKKEQALKVRVEGETADRVNRIANGLHISPSALARALLEEFVRAHEAHGSLLAWPPRFAFYQSPPSGTATLSQPNGKTTYESTKPQPRAIAADARPGKTT